MRCSAGRSVARTARRAFVVSPSSLALALGSALADVLVAARLEAVARLGRAGGRGARAVARMRSRNVAIVVAEAGGPPAPTRWPDRVALVLGSERHGVSPDIRALADRVVSIPGSGRVESLNVSVAAAILLDRATHRAG